MFIIEDYRKDFDAAYLGATINRAMGGEAVIPSWIDARSELDEMLSSPPEEMDDERQLHMMALGLR